MRTCSTRITLTFESLLWAYKVIVIFRGTLSNIAITYRRGPFDRRHKRRIIELSDPNIVERTRSGDGLKDAHRSTLPRWEGKQDILRGGNTT